MPQRIVIEGDIVQVIEETIVSTAPIASIMPHLERRLPVSVGPLPAGIRFLAYDKDQKTASLLIERPPMVQTIRLHYKSNNGPTADRARKNAEARAEFKVSLPYMLWAFRGSIDTANFIRIDSASHWFSPRPTAKLDDRLYAAVMPNIFNGGNICWGGTGATAGYGLDRLGTLVNEFLTTEFNDHLDARFPHTYQSYTDWEKATETDQLCWQSWDWNAWSDVTRAVSEVIDTNTPPAVYNFDFVIPTPPPSFTLELARQWIRSIPVRSREVMLAAITHEGAGQK